LVCLCWLSFFCTGILCDYPLYFVLDKTRELEMRVKISEDASENAKRELKDYKDKAARILQVSYRERKSGLSKNFNFVTFLRRI